jgi:hypothetical protein
LENGNQRTREALPLIKRAMVIHVRHRARNGANDIHAEFGTSIYLKVLQSLQYTRAEIELDMKSIEQEAATSGE